MHELVASAGAAVAAWFAVYFIGKPVVALQRQRIAALQVAERYYAVDPGSDEAERDAAVKALFESGIVIRSYDRGWSTAVRLWCWAWGYDLDLAAQALFGLAESARGTTLFPPDARRNTLNALYVALGAHKHLPRETVDAIKTMIAQTKAAGAAPQQVESSPS
ncbi:hypothetical protein LPW26_00715 [Rhodopseudomonas sp. HC1]|uniref:hypothetical protein n=1 Tax=Rhodopseudomonas infernalis TaxID=2897386 RepID=UPI001EE791F5|nr:hypothetical protein [Rhodopseudomonas infernalis]MCG6203144.1 hypothetical protein [Rhodopseudomonas infernalis]